MKIFDRFPARFVAPNAVTCTGLVIGLASIYTSFTSTTREGFLAAAWFILYSVLLDKLDGTVARGLKASSEFGVQLDSFSDFVTFGMAPAALIIRAIPWALPEWESGTSNDLLMALGALYVLAAALRLAKFNVTTATIGPKFFLGLPSTSSGGIIASGFLAKHELDLDDSVLKIFVGALFINAVLMVSNLPQPKLHLSKMPSFRVFQIFVVLSVYILVPLHRFPTYIFLAATLYTVIGFVYGLTVGHDVLMARDEDDASNAPATPTT
jgi:CDP-diacylglycerol---serine O-phosphatidyltransferase